MCWWRGSVMFSFPGTHKHKLGWNSIRSRVNRTSISSNHSKNTFSIYCTLYKSQVHKFIKSWFFAYEGYVSQSLRERLEFSGNFQLIPPPPPHCWHQSQVIQSYIQTRDNGRVLPRVSESEVRYWYVVVLIASISGTTRITRRDCVTSWTVWTSQVYTVSYRLKENLFLFFFLLVSIDPDKSDNMTWRIRDEFINIVHICLIRIFCLFTSKHSHGVVKTFPSLPRINFNSAELYIFGVFHVSGHWRYAQHIGVCSKLCFGMSIAWLIHDLVTLSLRMVFILIKNINCSNS